MVCRRHGGLEGCVLQACDGLPGRGAAALAERGRNGARVA